MPNIAIIILNWNGKEDTLASLQSIERLEYPNFQVILVDNGSSDDSVTAIRAAYPHIFLIETGANLGFAEGNNVGIRAALKTDADFILLLNNDTIVDAHLLTAFMTRFNAHPEVSILGAKLYQQALPDTLDHWGGCWNPKTARFDLIGLAEKEPKRPPHLDYVCGAALIARRSAWEQIGLLEARFFLIWEEADWCMRAKQHHLNIDVCDEAIVWHKGSASFRSKAHSTYFWWRNRLLWIERNCDRKEVARLYIQKLLPEIAHLLKIYLLKKGQLALRKKIAPNRCFKSQEEKQRKTRAALQGVFDYARRRFGNAPDWIYKLYRK